MTDNAVQEALGTGSWNLTIKIIKSLTHFQKESGAKYYIIPIKQSP